MKSPFESLAWGSSLRFCSIFPDFRRGTLIFFSTPGITMMSPLSTISLPVVATVRMRSSTSPL